MAILVRVLLGIIFLLLAGVLLILQIGSVAFQNGGASIFANEALVIIPIQLLLLTSSLISFLSFRGVVKFTTKKRYTNIVLFFVFSIILTLGYAAFQDFEKLNEGSVRAEWYIKLALGAVIVTTTCLVSVISFRTHDK